MSRNESMKDSYRSVCYYSLGQSDKSTLSESSATKMFGENKNRKYTANEMPNSSKNEMERNCENNKYLRSSKPTSDGVQKDTAQVETRTNQVKVDSENSEIQVVENGLGDTSAQESYDKTQVFENLRSSEKGKFTKHSTKVFENNVLKHGKRHSLSEVGMADRRHDLNVNGTIDESRTSNIVSNHYQRSISVDSGKQLQDVSDPAGMTGEWSADLRCFQDELRQCTDFAERRKIRDKIRKLRERKLEVGNVSEMGRCSPPQCDKESASCDITQKIKNLSAIDSITELRKLLSETNDYNEKKQIRLALRQLRQRDKERENNRDAGLTDRRRSLDSQCSNKGVVRESGDRPNRSFTRRISEEKTSSECNTPVQDSVSSRRQSVTLPIRGHNTLINTQKILDQTKIQCKKKDSEETITDRKPPIVPSRKDSYGTSQEFKHFSPISRRETSPSLLQSSHHEDSQQSHVTLRRSNSRSNSVVAATLETSPTEWLEKKKRSSSLPSSDRSQLSTLDMEAAFSELLSAVDEDKSASDSEEKSITQNNGIIEEEKPSPTEEKPSPIEQEKPNSTEGGKISCAVLKVDCNRHIQPAPSTVSVIEGDDGSVTVQSVSQKDQGDHTITEKTRLRRTESHSKEEERDTVIESKITSPGGTDNYSKDVIKTRRKITSRGSDYFTRSSYNIRKKTDFDGQEIEERDFTVESDNFSVSKGESWGDRAEAKVQLSRKVDSKDTPKLLDTPKTRQSSTSQNEARLSPTKNLDIDKQVSVSSRMDISKASSGYGTGSDDEEKDEIGHAYHGKPSGCPEIKSMLHDVSTSEGKTAVLECSVACSPPPSVTWYRGNKMVSEGTSYDPASGKASLTLCNVSREKAGEYRCVFSNLLGEAQTKAKLTVIGQSGKPPRFLASLMNMTVTEGHAVVLECEVTDASQVFWYKDGIIQRNSADFKQTFDGSKAKLEICEIFLDDHGEYACVAKNDKGESKSSCRIKVEESSGDGDVVPQFLSKPESSIYNFGDLILLECDVIGSPQPKISWFRDGNKLCANSRCKILYDGRVALIKISQSVTEDSGKYEVVAENPCGKVSVDCLIVVKAKEGPPAILHALSDTTATCGKPLTLQCQIKGSPCPMILWRKDGRMIGNTSDFKQTYQDNIANLMIKDVIELDGGCYECVARNSFGAVSSSCTITVQGKSSENTPSYVSKKTDWLVGRGNVPSQEDNSYRKVTTVKRSESVHVTSRQNFSLKSRFDIHGANHTDNHVVQNTSRSNKPNVERVSETKTHSTAKPCATAENFSSNTAKLEKFGSNNDKQSITSHVIDSKRMGSGRDSQIQSSGKDSQIQNSEIDSQKSNSAIESQKHTSKDFSKLLTSNEKTKTEGGSEPVWKSVALRRTESARVNNYGREKPLSWKKQEEPEKVVPSIVVENVDAVPQDKPNGWRPVVMDGKIDKPQSRQKEAAHQENKNVDIVSKFLFSTQQKEKRDMNDNKIISPESSSVEKNRNLDKLKTETTGLNRSQSMRMLFENLEANKNAPVNKFTPKPVAQVQKRDLGLRRTSSLKVLPGEMESFREQHRKKTESSINKSTENIMASYDTIEDEDELHKLLSKSENFEERKKIRSRMKELREKKQKEWEAKKTQREKETGDLVKKKFEQAEKEKKQYLQKIEQSAKEASAERERILQKSEELIQDKLKHAEEDKKRTLETFDKLAKHDDTRKVTVQKTQDGGILTTIINDTKLYSGVSSKLNAEDAATYLTNQLISTASPVTSGNITIKTESWSSKDGVTNTSQKSESWGAKPPGAAGAKAMFQKMDAGAPKPNHLAPGGRGGGSKGLVRSPSAIKQMLLDWTKAMTREYENVEITNFSSCWNNGMAFCALIHHFYPEAFDFSSLDPKKRRYNFTLAFDTAEKYADIAPLLDVEDMVRMQKPDWKCVFTYVQSVYRKLHTHERNTANPNAGQ